MSAGADYPRTWTWRAAAKASGPAVVFDIDGVLADASGRQHHLAGLRRDWDAFFAECGEDPIIPQVARLLELVSPERVVILLTARQQETDILRGFTLGADAYIVKPFNPLELAARLKRLLRK